jgi:signal transduction histidine kinase
MALRDWLRPPGPLLTALVASSLASGAALAWMGWDLVRQERAAAGQRVQESLEAAADRAAADLRALLAEQAEHAGDWAVDPPPAGEVVPASLLLVFQEGHLQAYPPDRMLFLPFPSAQPDLSAPFAHAEAIEFRQRRPDEAERLYRDLTASRDTSVRAGALLRLARVLRARGNQRAALETYERLATLGGARVAGLPAELVGRHARCEVLHGSGDGAAALAECERVRHDLETARWPLTRGQFDFYWSDTARLMGVDDQWPAAAALSEVAAAAWTELQKQPAPRGFDTIWIADHPWLVLWRAAGGRQTALILKPEPLTAQVADGGGWLVEVLDGQGRVVAGKKGLERPAAVRTMAESGLPWTLRVTTVEAELLDSKGRERFLLSGLAVLIGLLVVGTYFIARSIRREAAVARLQSDFVSAVSHEFRSPLSAMRVLSEMLALGRIPSDDQRQRYYDTLVRETRRLQQLVETLLDFGRMEAGARPYRFEQCDAAKLVAQVAAEFEPIVSSQGRRIEVLAPTDSCLIEADPEAMSLALRNLIDNALKYSPGRPVVWVECGRDGEQVSIGVRDEGLGIGAEERAAIFRKFMRGRAAREVHAEGTGVGLALVRHIIRAHSGEIRLESEPGKGSTFTMLLRSVKCV